MAPKGNKNAVGHVSPRSGRKGHAIMHSLPYEEWMAFRDAAEAQKGRILNNGEQDEMWREICKQAVRAFIEAPKPETKWTVALLHGGKEIQNVKDLSEEEAFTFAMKQKHAKIDDIEINCVICYPQNRSNIKHIWKADDGQQDPDVFDLKYRTHSKRA